MGNETSNNQNAFSDENVSKVLKWTLFIAGVCLSLYLMHRLRSVLIPFAVAVVLSYMLNPLVVMLQKALSFPRGLAAVMVVLTTVIIIIGAAAALIPAILSEVNSFNTELTAYLERNETGRATAIMDMLNLNNLLAYLPELMPKIEGILMGTANAVSGLFNVFIIILYMIFLLIDYNRLTEGCKSLVPSKYMTPISKVVEDVRRSMQMYFRSQGLIAFIVGVMLAVGFTIIGLPLGVLIGLGMGLMNMVPYLQLAGVPVALLLAASKSLKCDTPMWQEMCLVLAVLLVVQIIQEAILNPRIMGKTYSLSPVAILLSLSVWGSLLGFLGMIIALPLTALLTSYTKHFIANKGKYQERYEAVVRNRRRKQNKRRRQTTENVTEETANK